MSTRVPSRPGPQNEGVYFHAGWHDLPTRRGGSRNVHYRWRHPGGHQVTFQRPCPESIRHVRYSRFWGLLMTLFICGAFAFNWRCHKKRKRWVFRVETRSEGATRSGARFRESLWDFDCWIPIEHSSDTHLHKWRHLTRMKTTISVASKNFFPIFICCCCCKKKRRWNAF